MPLYFALAKIVKYGKLEQIPMLFHRGCCRILGLRIQTSGELSARHPVLFVSNHISYLDIFVLGGIVPGCFIAKSEVASWPILGSLAKIQNTLFFERKGNRVRSQIQVMENHLRGGGNLILFPEGTSTEGVHVEPFKSTLFHAAELELATPITIQPITISYTLWKGRTMTQAIREYFAWYGPMPFASHFYNMMGMGSATVELKFHTPVQLKDFESRKACAEYCYQQVSNALENSLTDKPIEVPYSDSPRETA